MSCDKEDKRVAASLIVSLSGYLITGALAVIAAQAAILTYIWEHRHYLIVFPVLSFLAFTFLLFSLYLAGKGIYEIYSDGHGGNWKIQTSNGCFNQQAICVLMGTCLVVLSLFFQGKPINNEPPAYLASFCALTRRVNIMELNIKALNHNFSLRALKAKKTGPRSRR